jgi:hypothetical protein
LSIKDGITLVKEELTSEEKLFEKSVITERFIKKYKKIMIGGVVVFIMLVGANFTYELNKESTVLA